MTAERRPEFDHRDPGTPETEWARHLSGVDLPMLELSRYRHVVVLSAHPDDETLGAGGLLAAAHRQGIPTGVIVATSGENSHPASTTHTPDELATRRRAEVFAALELVAPSASVQLLGWPDGGLAERVEDLTAAISDAVPGPDTLLVSPWSRDGHPDHEAVGAAAERAALRRGAVLLQYPIWAWHWAVPDGFDPAMVRLGLGADDQRAKAAALARHVTQTDPLSDAPGDEAVVGPDFARHFDRPYEIFVMPSGPSPDSTSTTGSDGRSLDGDFFDEFYQGQSDPWGFETRWYEERKRALTLAALPRRRFRSAFEPGCSIGVLTAELAARCDSLLATDISEVPLAAARTRLADAPWVRFERRTVPQEWPDAQFDLIVLSEMAYYCSSADLARLIDRAARSLTEDGVLVACHWRHPVPEYPLGGDEVHRALEGEAGLVVLARHEEEDFRLDVLVRPPGRSVARESGLLG
ncbi:bifunctional PIG-L family deacetylase/class I SAM-dependent methyltransferase [Nakamurella panacisegetis]|uniref:bifunctional PIG-L family deacetylase/class I SAM-dependent methyltransferase n=1 Tax=Nakamurella panacisegetis TaxID=1090615 RepID=UPI0018D4200E|nr:bifunctional PIG-L family deacetylase/class I SAM-dependent methyltransferase [Nakamurella panacisegetis]